MPQSSNNGWFKKKPRTGEWWYEYVKIDANTDCHLWQKGCNSAGYGKVWFNGRTLSAHRVVWECVHGAVPEGMNVLHACDVPPCVNVNHLFLGTFKDNTQDMWKKGRQGKRAEGEEHPLSKLTAEQVRAIRADPRPLSAIGKDYGISLSNAGLIKQRLAWKHVT